MTAILIPRRHFGAYLIFFTATWLTSACSNVESDNAERGLTIVTSQGRVLAYKAGWSQGVLLDRQGSTVHFGVASMPQRAFLTPDGRTALFLDATSGRLTAIDVTTGTPHSRVYFLRECLETVSFSEDSRFALFQAAPNVRCHSGIFDPNHISLVDLAQQRSENLSVGSNPNVVAFYRKGNDPRLLLFTPSRMTQVRIAELFKKEPAADWKQTRDLSRTIDLSKVPLQAIQTGDVLFVLIAGSKEFLSVSLGSEEELPPINFEADNVETPISMALSPPIPATAETVFPHDTTRETRFLYVLNANKTLSVFDATNLSRSRVLDVSHVSDTPDTLHATPDGKRVLFYKAKGAQSLYRLNLRTGNIGAIPFKLPVSRFVHSPDGKSVIALHARGEEGDDAFTFVNFKELFEPILLPGPIAEVAMTSNGGHVVFRLQAMPTLIRFDLVRGLLSQVRLPQPKAREDAGNVDYQPIKIGPTGIASQIFVWFNHPFGYLAFVDLDAKVEKQEPATIRRDFVLDGIFDR